MRHIIVKVSENTKIGVIGDIHEHHEHFFSIVNQFNPTDDRLLVSVGDIFDKGFGEEKAYDILDEFISLKDKNKSYLVLGNHDFRQIRKYIRSDKKMPKQIKWLDQQPFSISFKWPNGKTLLVLHGGVTPKHTEKDLADSEIMFVRTVSEDGKYLTFSEKQGTNWHEFYDGRFGYICAGHAAQKDGIPKYYKHSCNVDTSCYSTGILTCQVFNSSGLDETIYAYGIPSKWPKFD